MLLAIVINILSLYIYYIYCKILISNFSTIILFSTIINFSNSNARPANACEDAHGNHHLKVNFLTFLYNSHSFSFSQTLAPTLEQISFIVDEGVGSVEVCMHFGGEGLNITATVNTDGTATST